ncbi:MAG: hypothetical protein U0361_22045 [Nitrospiraceae bacterium]
MKKRMEVWLAHAPICNGYPSKLDTDTGANCNDGDMALFSGLLCAAQVKYKRQDKDILIGCDAVAASQDDTGQWYRSPRRRLDHTIDEEERSGNVASFSPDMAIGVQLYLASMKDVDRGNLWLKWLDTHRPCWGGNEPECRIRDPRTGIELSNVRGLPRFCLDPPGPPQSDENEIGRVFRRLGMDFRCSMRPGDLAILGQTRASLNLYGTTPEDKKICSDTTSNAGMDFGARFARLDRLLNLTKLDNVLAIVDGGLPYVMRLACPESNSWIRLNAEYNDKGFSQHLVAISILQLRQLGVNNPILKDSAARLLAKQPENPFFMFLKQGKSEEVLKKIFKHCPKDEQESKTSRKTQWLWEREFTNQNWKGTSSLWDCIFIGNLWIKGT